MVPSRGFADDLAVAASVLIVDDNARFRARARRRLEADAHPLAQPADVGCHLLRQRPSCAGTVEPNVQPVLDTPAAIRGDSPDAAGAATAVSAAMAPRAGQQLDRVTKRVMRGISPTPRLGNASSGNLRLPRHRSQGAPADFAAPNRRARVRLSDASAGVWRQLERPL